MDSIRLKRFSDSIQYQFENIDLLRQALTHSSTQKLHNERLEFLGDATLGAVVSEYLYLRYADASEGELSLRRSRIVNNQNSLCRIGAQMALHNYVQVNKGFPWGNETASRNLLANAVEALIGAIYLDGGISAAKEFIYHHILPAIESGEQSTKVNSKSKLQEYLQKRAQPVPQYELIQTTGRDHKPKFVVACQAQGLRSKVIGEGGSMKEAEQNAAAIAYEQLTQ